MVAYSVLIVRTRSRSNDGWSNIEAVTWTGRDPPFINYHETLDQFQYVVSVELLVQSWTYLLCWRYGVDLRVALNVVQIFLDGACSDLVDIDALFHRRLDTPEKILKGIRDGVFNYTHFHALKASGRILKAGSSRV